MTDGQSETSLLVAFARLEGKVDLTLNEIAKLSASDTDHETRLRAIEATPAPDGETDRRIRALEDRRTVSPGQLWAGLIGVLGAGGAIMAIVNGFVNLLR